MDLERPVFARRFVQLQARFKQKKVEKGATIRCRSSSEETKHSKRDGKGDTKGKRPKCTSPSGKSHKLV